MYRTCDFVINFYEKSFSAISASCLPIHSTHIYIFCFFFFRLFYLIKIHLKSWKLTVNRVNCEKRAYRSKTEKNGKKNNETKERKREKNYLFDNIVVFVLWVHVWIAWRCYERRFILFSIVKPKFIFCHWYGCSSLDIFKRATEIRKILNFAMPLAKCDFHHHHEDMLLQ